MAKSITNASRVHVVKKSIALDTTLFTLFNKLIISGVQAGDCSSWKFVLLFFNLDNHWCNSMWILPKKIS